MADDRERTTHVSASMDIPYNGFDMFAFQVAADICEERGCTEAAAFLREATGHDYTTEKQRPYGWASNQRSNKHFFLSLTGGRSLAICGTRIEWPFEWMCWFHSGHVCNRCAAELERRQAEFPEAWEAHLISMDESRPMLAKEPQ